MDFDVLVAGTSHIGPLEPTIEKRDSGKLKTRERAGSLPTYTCTHHGSLIKKSQRVNL